MYTSTESPMARSRVETIWESSGALARATRAGLMPLGWLYGAVVSLRNSAFDAGVFTSRSLGIPTVSVGNLTVGGTGKTPVAAWLAGRLAEAVPLCEEALKRTRARLGPDHPETLQTQRGLSELHLGAKKYAEAEKIARPKGFPHTM